MTVKRFECSSAERLAGLLASDPNTPYRAHRTRIGYARYDDWAASRGALLVCKANGAFESEDGAIGWNRLSWDSELFGFPAARLEILVAAGAYSEARATASELLRATLADAAGAGIRHMVARIDCSLNSHAHALEENGFELIDGIQTFALDLTVRALAAPPANTRLATVADADEVAAIARSSFVYDRFHKDIAIGMKAADQLHEAWARNSVSGDAADAVLLATTDGSVDGFVTVKIDASSAGALGIRLATIPLVATATGARGRGSARRATEAVLAWCHAREVDIVEVGTQISNIPAARLYQSAGFRTTAISLTYRKIIE